jgi:predicted XRE-type DNA-binding protein
MTTANTPTKKEENGPSDDTEPEEESLSESNANRDDGDAEDIRKERETNTGGTPGDKAGGPFPSNDVASTLTGEDTIVFEESLTESGDVIGVGWSGSLYQFSREDDLSDPSEIVQWTAEKIENNRRVSIPNRDGSGSGDISVSQAIAWTWLKAPQDILSDDGEGRTGYVGDTPTGSTVYWTDESGRLYTAATEIGPDAMREIVGADVRPVEKCSSTGEGREVVITREGIPFTIKRSTHLRLPRMKGEILQWKAERRMVENGRNIRYQEVVDEEKEVVRMTIEEAVARAWVGGPESENLVADYEGESPTADTVFWKERQTRWWETKPVGIKEAMEKGSSYREKIYLGIRDRLLQLFDRSGEKEAVLRLLGVRLDTARAIVRKEEDVHLDRLTRLIGPKDRVRVEVGIQNPPNKTRGAEILKKAERTGSGLAGRVERTEHGYALTVRGDEGEAEEDLRNFLGMMVSIIVDARGWSQRQAADELGTTQPWISKMVRGVGFFRIDRVSEIIEKARVPVTVEISGSETLAVEPAE